MGDDQSLSGISLEMPVPHLIDDDSILNEEDEVLLDSWIKELESGVQRMSGLLSSSDVPGSPPVATGDPAPPPNYPAPPPPLESGEVSALTCIWIYHCNLGNFQ